MKRKAIVCDIDGVCLQTDFILDEIHKLGLKGEEKWEYFYENCNSDRVEVIPKILEFIRFFDEEGIMIIFSTARNKKCERQTKNKFKKEGICWDDIYMRKDNDLRPACEVKREHLIEIMKEFDIVAFIDDDIDNCEMAKSLGVLALRRV